MPGACRLWPCARTHLQKALYRIPPVGRTDDKYSRPNPRFWYTSPVVWGALRSAVFSSARLGRVLPQHWRFPPASVGPSPQAFTLIWGAGYFWQCRMRVGDGLVTIPTIKTALCQTRSFGGRVTDNIRVWSASPVVWGVVDG